MKKRLLAAAIAAAMTLSLGATAFAAEISETDQLRQEIAKLSAKLAQLEAKQNATAAKVNAPTPKPNVNFFFDNRIQYNHSSLGPTDGGGYLGQPVDQKGQFMERIRVYMSGNVGDKWQWNSRLHHTKWNIDGADGTGVKFDRFWVTNKDILGGTLDVGRQGLFPGKALFWNYIGDTDAAVYTGKADKVTYRIGAGQQGGTGKTTTVSPITIPSLGSFMNTIEVNTDGQQMKFAEISYKPTKTSDIGILYLKQNNPTTSIKQYLDGGLVGTYSYNNFNDLDILAINGAFEIPNAKGLALSFEWGKNNANDYTAGTYPYNVNFKGGQSGYFVALQSKYAATNIHPMLYTSMVNPFKQKDHGWAISYRHMPSGMAGLNNRATSATVAATTDADGTFQNTFDGINAWRFDYIYVPWKNVQWTFTYDRIKPIEGNWTNHSIQSTLNFFF